MTQKGIIKSVCRICHGGCSALLHVEDGILTKIEPDQNSPFNQGQMCIKGLSTPDMMYHPSRLLKPLKRDGERGSMRWKEVDWETALTEIADRLDRIRQESGTEAVALGQGTGRHHFMHVIRFANSFGTPNWYEPGFANCLLPRITVCQLTYGGYVVADYYGKTLPKTILFWGHNPLVSGPDGELSFPVQRALQAGSVGIAIDPRRSETARQCKLWLPIRPGTDAALALAMLHVIISEDIYDHAFVEQWTIGFEALKSHVAECTPQWAATITWIPAADIVEAARRYALDTPSVIEWGVAIEHTPNALQTVRAIALLRGITGNIDRPGADILGMNIVRPYPVLRQNLPRNASQKRISSQDFKFLSGFPAYLPSAHLPAIFRAMRTGEPYRVRGVLNFGSNPLTTVANAREVEQALRQLDLLVVADMFMTPTAALADYVLPAAFWPEVTHMVELPYIAENAVLAQQKAVQVGACLQDEEILNELARKLHLPGSEDSLEDVLNIRLSSLKISFEELKTRGMIFPDHVYQKFKAKGFRTPSKKVELYCRTLERLGYDPLPSYHEPPESPISTPDLAQRFPYILTTGSRRREFFHSEQRQIPRLRKRHPDPLVEMHPATAAQYAIADGDWVAVSSPRGTIRMKAAVTEDIHEQVINVEHGWWFPEQPGPEFGVWQSNANLLTSDAPPYDPAFGTYQLRALLCRIEKISDCQT